jgi:hypothetical protein
VPLWIAESGGDAIHAGAALVPMLVGWAVGSTLGVPAMVAWGMRAVQLGGTALASIGASTLAVVVSRSLPSSFAFAALGLLGLGLGPFASVSVLGPQARVGWASRGVVTSLVHASRALGGSLAVALLACVGDEGKDASASRFAVLASVAWAGLFVLAWASPRGRLDATGAEAHGVAS